MDQTQSSTISTLAAKYAPNLTSEIEYDEYPVILGAGTSARVQKVRFAHNGLEAASKKFISRSNQPSGFLSALDYELDILRHLHHPNILTPIGVQWSDQPYVFYPLCETSLNALTFDQAPAALAATRFQIASQLISAVHYLHSNNIIHGDIKPDNVLILHSNPLQIVLADFGSSINLNNSGQQPASTFTEQYCSPGLAKSGIFSFGSDLYALALTLFRLFSPKLPWPGVNSQFTVLNNLKNDQLVQIPTTISQPYRSLIQTLIQAENNPHGNTGLATLLSGTEFCPRLLLPSNPPQLGTNFKFRFAIKPDIKPLSEQLVTMLNSGPGPEITAQQLFSSFCPVNDEQATQPTSAPVSNPVSSDDPGEGYVLVEGKWVEVE